MHDVREGREGAHSKTGWGRLGNFAFKKVLGTNVFQTKKSFIPVPNFRLILAVNSNFQMSSSNKIVGNSNISVLP